MVPLPAALGPVSVSEKTLPPAATGWMSHPFCHSFPLCWDFFSSITLVDWPCTRCPDPDQVILSLRRYLDPLGPRVDTERMDLYALEIQVASEIQDNRKLEVRIPPSKLPYLLLLFQNGPPPLNPLVGLSRIYTAVACNFRGQLPPPVCSVLCTSAEEKCLCAPRNGTRLQRVWSHCAFLVRPSPWEKDVSSSSVPIPDHLEIDADFFEAFKAYENCTDSRAVSCLK